MAFVNSRISLLEREKQCVERGGGERACGQDTTFGPDKGLSSFGINMAFFIGFERIFFFFFLKIMFGNYKYY